MVFRLLKDDVHFPDPGLAEPDGLLAIGGDLSTERLLMAYQNGIFPWFSEDDPILWYAPHERCVIFPDRIKVSKSMKKILREATFQVTINQDFPAVIRQCAQVPRNGQLGTWITPEMRSAYTRLHELGIAHSIEVWQNQLLVGGLYGVRINSVFCGESMFSIVSNASKIALIYLAEQPDISMIDCQLPNDHLMSLGAEMITGSDFLSRLCH
ncbi:MAG: leucyl/phenylalanyl-tRNA--protein transferase [Pedobacter sp.]|nr:leucyl/phenylalanyl-tRNA--protein transferase [Pedobacter sp.]MDQ8053204.1 leucyl/phenylalanyl-tRNA--protein transferase [Pedobacter sp.]